MSGRAAERKALDATLGRLCASNLDGNDPLLEAAIETLRVEAASLGLSEVEDRGTASRIHVVLWLGKRYAPGMSSTATERTEMKFPEPEYREQRNSQGALRTYVRYPGQSRWYAHLVTAQIALQRIPPRRTTGPAILHNGIIFYGHKSLRVYLERKAKWEGR